MEGVKKLEERRQIKMGLFSRGAALISDITMLPQGRIASTDLGKLTLEEGIVHVAWRMLEYNYPWYDGELTFGYVPPKLLDANVMSSWIEAAVIKNANFTKDNIRCPKRVNKLEWHQTLWRFYWLHLIAAADMQKIWGIVSEAREDPSRLLDIEERNDYLRAVALISAIPPGRVAVYNKYFDKLVSISHRVRKLEIEARKYAREELLWFFPDITHDRGILTFSIDE